MINLNIESSEDTISLPEMREFIFSIKNRRDRALVSFLYWTGRRISEALSVTISDIKKTKTAKGEDIVLVTCMILKKRKYFKRKKDGKMVEKKPLFIKTPFPYSDDIAKIYIDYYEQIKKRYKTGKIFVITPERAWQIIKEINPKIKPHWFRHNRATHLASVMSAPELTAYFGWSDIKIAMRYIHSQPEQVLGKMMEL